MAVKGWLESSGIEAFEFCEKMQAKGVKTLICTDISKDGAMAGTNRALYRELRALKDRHPSWSLCAITSDPGFEKSFGLRADKKRRLYNGRLECTYYIYYGRRKPVSA